MKREGLRHPKTLDLMSRLSINRREAIGLLDMLWDWAIDYAPSGDVGKWSNGVIAGALEWLGDAESLVAALVGCKWLDENEQHRLIIHDWPDHAPQFHRAKLKKLGLSFLDCYENAERSLEGSELDSGETVEGNTPLLSANPCKPNQTAAAAQQGRGAAAAAEVSSDEWEQATPLAKRLRSELYRDQPKLADRDWLWLARVAVLGIRYGPDFYEPGFEALKNTKANSPIALMKTVLDDELQRLGTRLNREISKIKIPPDFLPKAKASA